MSESRRVTRRIPARASHGDALTRRMVVAEPPVSAVGGSTRTSDRTWRQESASVQLGKRCAEPVADEHIRWLFSGSLEQSVQVRPAPPTDRMVRRPPRSIRVPRGRSCRRVCSLRRPAAPSPMRPTCLRRAPRGRRSANPRRRNRYGAGDRRCRPVRPGYGNWRRSIAVAAP